MKYYSESTGEFYPSVEECEQAEKAYSEEKAAKEAKEKEALTVTSKRRKELADNIKKIDKEISAAEDELHSVCKEAEKIMNEAKEKASSMRFKAQQNLREKKKERLEAIQAFNKEFGVYTRTYTGEDALSEYVSAFKTLDDLFDCFWW